MATVVGGFSGRSQYRLVFDVWEASYNVANNDSWVQWNLRIDESPNYGSWSNAALTWSVSVHGQGWSGSTKYDFRNYDSLGLGSGGRGVGHQSDGSQEIGFSASAGGGTTIGGASCSGAIWLTTIPRKSTPTFVSPGYESLILGQNSYMVMNRADGSFIHDLDWYFGSGAGRAISAAGHDGNWTVPMGFADYLPNTNTGVGTMKTYTYSAGYGSHIGTVDQNFRVYVPDNASTKPTFTSKSVAEANSAVTTVMGAGKYVQGLSKIKGTMGGASAKYSASVSARRMDVAGQAVQLTGSSPEGTTPNPIASSGTVPVSFTVTDSRGFSYAESTNIDVLPYAVPAITAVSASRANSSGVAQEDGTYIRVNLNAVVQSLVNSTQRNRLTIRAYTRARGATAWTLKATPVNDSSTLTYNSNFFFSGPFAVDQGYEVRIEVIDKFATTAWEGTIAVAGVFQHWAKDTSVSPARSVMGIGKYWERGVLDVAGDIYNGAGSLVDPVGGIMPYAGANVPTGWLLCNGQAVSRTAYPALFAVCGTAYGAGNGSSTFNVPDLRFRVPVGRDAGHAEFNTLGQAGGAKTHALTAAESGMPAHNHYISDAVIAWGPGQPWANGHWPAGGYIGGINPTTSTAGPANASQAHNNLQPYLTVNFIIKAL